MLKNQTADLFRRISADLPPTYRRPPPTYLQNPPPKYIKYLGGFWWDARARGL